MAILGCGTIAQSAHLPAYEKYGVGVTGVWSRTREHHRRRSPSGSPSSAGVYASAEELLADPEVRFVDIATRPEERLRLDRGGRGRGQARAGPEAADLSEDDLGRLPGDPGAAEAAGVRVAVNHNGRWAPPWRAATLLVRDGAIGEVVGVTHLHDKPLPPLAGTPFDDVPHMLLTDYLVHWVDITRTWLADGGAGAVASVQATDSRVPGQPPRRATRGRRLTMATARGGATATLRIVGDVRRLRARAARSGCTAPTAPCAAACCWTRTGSSSTTATPLTDVPLQRRVVRRRLRRQPWAS